MDEDQIDRRNQAQRNWPLPRSREDERTGRGDRIIRFDDAQIALRQIRRDRHRVVAGHVPIIGNCEARVFERARHRAFVERDASGNRDALAHRSHGPARRRDLVASSGVAVPRKCAPDRGEFAGELGAELRPAHRRNDRQRRRIMVGAGVSAILMKLAVLASCASAVLTFAISLVNPSHNRIASAYGARLWRRTLHSGVTLGPPGAGKSRPRVH